MADIVINPAVGKIDFFSVKGDNVTNTLKLSGNTLLVTGPLSASSISTGGGGAFVTSVQPTSNFLSKFTGNSTIANSVIYDNGTNIGIGTTSPAYKLHVEGTGTQRINVVTTDGASAGSGIYFQVKNAGSLVSNSTLTIDNTGNLKIFTGTSTESERMRVTSTGCVGIGTTSVRLNSLLDVYGSGVFGTSSYGFYVGTDATGTFLDAGTQLIRMFAGQSERMRIATDGNIGIGTTAASAKLQVNSTTAGSTVVRADGTSGTLFSVVDDLTDSLMSVNNSAGLPVFEVFADDRIVGGQYGVNDFVITNNRVGIGTSNPLAELHVTSSTSLPSAVFLGGNVGIGTTNPTTKLAVSDGTTIAQVNPSSGVGYFGTVNNYPVALSVNSSEKVRIFSGGSVSFGTTADTLFSAGNIYLNGATGNAAGPVVAFGQSDSVTGGIGHLARITGGGTSQDIFIQSQGASNSIGLNANPSGAAIYFQTQGAEKVRITSAGNVGIGTSTPATKLDIYGPVSVRGTTVLTTNFDLNAGNATDIYGNIRVLRGASLNDGMYIGYGGAGGNLKFFSNSGTTEFMTIATTGNVGIGSTSPAAKLDIVGTNTTIALSFGTTVPNNPLFINTYGSNTGIGMDQATAGLRLVGDYGGGTNPLTDIGYYAGGSVSHANWVSRFKVVNSGATVFTANVYHSIGSQRLFGGSGGTHNYIYTGTTTLNFVNAADNSTLMTLLNGGSVGIGTTSPLSKLDVRGNLYVNYGVNGTGYVQTNGSDSDLQITTATNLTTLMNTGGSAGLAFGAGNSERMRITSGGNLGIGTTSGTFTLNVYNNADVWHARFGSAAGELRIGGQTSSGAVIQSFVPGSSTVRDLYIQRDGGNVGIGTTTTSYKLTVNGDLAFNGGLSTRMLVSYTNLTNGEDWANSPISIRERDQVGNTQLADKYAPNLNFHWANRASKSVWMDANGILNWGEYDASGIPAADGTFKTAILLATSNVGIGTTSPTQRLEVAGIAMAGQGAYRTSIYGDNGGAYLYFGTTANTSVLGTIGAYGGVFNINSLNGDTSFQYNGSEKMRITTGGNVGIGTSSPSIKLAVDGEASFGDGSKLTLIGLDINSQVTPNFIKIRTKIPFASGAADFTINIKGFRYGGVESTSLMICWHYYLSTFYNPTISSAGSYAPTVKLSAEDWDSSGTPKVCIVLVGPGYWPKLYVESMYSSNYNDAYADGWDWVDADATGTGNNLAILSYKSNFGNSFVMTSGGNVGIGTTSPGTSLEVYAVPATSTTLRQMLIINTDFASATGTGFGGSIVFRGRTAGNLLRDNAQITAYNEDIGDNGYALGFFTRPNDTLGMVQRLTIVRGGNVGIGTTSPSTKLDVAGTINISNGSANLRRLSFDASGVYYNWIESGGSAGAGYMAFAAGNSESMRIITGGNVGIGTSSPTATLQVGTNSSGTASGDNSVIARIGGSNAAGRVYNLTLANTATATVSNESAMSFIVAGNYSATGIISAVLRSTVNAATDLVFTNYNGSLQERMRILHDGNVGIGTTSPSTKLHIYENANRVTYISQNDNHTARFEAYGTATAIDTTASNGIFFRINSGDIVKFAADGNVGIGTSTATAPLHIYRASNPWIRLNGGGSFGYIRLDDGTSNGYLFKNTSSDTSNGALAGAMYTYTDSGKAFQHIHSGTPLFTILSGGNVGIGTTSPISLLDVRNGYITAGSSASTNGSTILAGYYSNSSGILTVLGTEYSSGGPVLGYAVSPSTSATGAFLSSTTITIPRSAYVQDGGTHRWYTGAAQTVAIGSAVSTSERMRINSDGNLGIGTSTPRQILHLNGSILLDGIQNGYEQGATRAIGYGSNSGAVNTDGFSGMDIQSVNAPAPNAGNYSQNLRFWTHHYGTGTGNTPRMVLQYNGNLGIGTTSPTQRLHVLTTGGSTTTPNIVATFQANTATTILAGGGTAIKFVGVSSGGNLQDYDQGMISTLGYADNNRHGMQFWVKPNASTVLTVGQTIDNNGNVGIGTTNPATLLHVDTAGADARIRVSAGTNTVQGGMIANTNGLVYAGSITNHGFSLRTNDTDRVRIQTDGNVGIGTTSAVSKLHVNGGMTFGYGSDATFFTGTEFDSSKYLILQNNTDSYGRVGLTINAKTFNGANTPSTNDGWALDPRSGIRFRGWLVGDSNYDTKFVIQHLLANATNAVGDLGIFAKGYSTTLPAFVLAGGGNVGIGTTSAKNKFAVIASDTYAYYNRTEPVAVFQGLSPSTVLISADANTNGAYSELKLGNAQSTYYTYSAYIRGIQGAGIDYYRLEFGTANGSAAATRMIIATDGNVGIGTTSPGALLNIRASTPTGTGTVTTGTNILLDSNTSNYITFRNTSDNGTYAGLIFLDNNVGGYITFGNSGAAVGSDSMIYGAFNDHIFQNGYVNETLYNRTETMRIKQNGNVGIGTSSPSATMDISKATGNYIFDLTNATEVGFKLRTYNSGSAVLNTKTFIQGLVYNGNFNSGINYYRGSGGTDGYLSFSTSGTERMMLDKNGNIGIGTTTTAAKLHVNSTTAGATLIRADGTSGTLFSVVDDLTDSLMSVNNSAGLPVFEVFADDRIVGGQYGANDFVITNNRVGIGTSNPLAELHVTGSASVPAAVFYGNVGIGTSTFSYPTSNRGLLELYGNADALLALRSAGTNFYIHKPGVDCYIVNTNSGFISIYNNGSERMSIRSDGKVGIGTSSPNSQLTILGDGTQNNVSGVLRVADTGSSKWGSIGLPDVQSTTTSANNFYLIGRGGAFTDRVLSIHIPNATDYGSGAQPKFGVYSTGADLLASVEASTGTSYFKGNVGIGSASPTQKLDVNGSIYTSGKLVQRSATQSLSGTTGCTIDLANGAVHILSLANATTISSFTYNSRDNNPSVNTIMLVVKYAGTASITFTNVIWANGATPTLTGTNGFADVFMLTSYQGGAGTPVWIGTVVAQALVSTNL